MKEYLNYGIIQYQLANLRQLTFEITDSCNLRCKYCGYGEFYEDYDNRKNKNLPISYAVLIIDYLLPYWNSEKNSSSDRNIYISFYGGEPLLNMQFIEQIIDYIEKLDCPNRHFSFSMTTNAILLHKYAAYLVEKDFNLLISLDGNFRNDAYRVDASGHPSFERVIRNVNFLQEKYPDYFAKKVNFNSVLHNKNSVEEIYRFFKEGYNKIPSIGELNNMGIRPEKRALFMQTYQNSQKSLYQSEHYEEIEKEMFIKSPSYQSVCTFLHQYSGFVFRDYSELLYGKPEKQHWITGTCPPFNKKMFVTVNGKILPCERIGQQFALGKVDKTGVHLDFEAIAQKYNRYFAKLEKQCGSCYNQKSCVQCIFNLDNIEEKPVCKGYMNKSDFERYTAWNMAFLEHNPEDYYRIMEEIIVE